MTAPVLLSFLFLAPGPGATVPAAPAPLLGKGDVGPPGLVLVKGGRTYVGSTKEDIEALLESSKDFLRVIDAERPQNKERVEDFYYMVTEVTNEQYLAFVQATGYRAPRSWAEGALDEARREFLKAEGDKRAAARDSGTLYDRKEFDQDAWWEENYATAAWVMPEEDAMRPVGYTSHDDALAYCAWAGLRLPTEAEFQRAVRGDKKDAYPWGDKWKPGAAATSEISGIQKALIVGELKEGRSEDGLYDLLGNVWEWTDSPYSPYEGFKKETYKIGDGKRKETLEVDFHAWDANKRVTVGGSFQNGAVAARATTRRETDREQRTNALGFRAAATPRIGLDIARSILEFEAKKSDARVQGSEFQAEAALVTDRWTTRPSASKEAPEHYAIIGGYDYFLWMPVSTLEFNDTGSLSRASRTTPIQLGFFSTSIPLAEPALPAGTYFVSYRGKGRDIEDKDAEKDTEQGSGGPSSEPQDEAGSEIDTKDENFLFYDAKTAQLVLTVEINATKTLGVLGMKFDKSRDTGAIGFKDEKVWQTPAEGSEPVQVVEQHLLLSAQIDGNVRGRALTFELQIKPDQAKLVAEGWRKQ